MSKEQALAFLKHAAENAELQEKIVALAAEEGYEFSVEELTDAELDEASGGVFTGYLKMPGIKGESFRTAIKIDYVGLDSSLELDGP